MKLRDWLIAGLVLAAFVLLRGKALLGPFVLPFETAFQEAIALHHLENGILENRLLPVIADMAGEHFYHTAHPPLLHIVYAGLYQVFGVHEAVTRLFSLVVFFSSVLLWRSLAGKEAPRGFAILVLGFAFPVSFLLSTTTNYEPLSILMISFIAWLVLRREAGLWLLLPAVAAGMLIDWPVYLAVPALLMVKWKAPVLRRRLLFVFGFEVVFFFLLQLYQYMVAGEAAVFSHAQERANPAGLFSSSLWSGLGEHLIGVLGTPAAVIAAAGLAWCLLLLVRGKLANNTVKESPADGHDLNPAREAFLFFLVFSVLLLLSAFQLVCRHYVYLLYFVPLVVFGLYLALSQRGLRLIALAAVFLVFAGRDVILSNDRNPGYYGMANSALLPEIETAFSTSAAGAWKFYAGAETAHPVSAAMDRYILEHSPELVHLDLDRYEVQRYKELVSRKREEYVRVFSLPGERMYLREDVYGKSREHGTREYLQVENKKAGSNYRQPVSKYIMPGREAAPVETAARQGWPVYAIRQHPGPRGSMLSITLPPATRQVALQPAIVHSFPFARSDGADFMALVSYNRNKNGQATVEHELVYFRHLRDGDPAAAGHTAVRFIKSPARLQLLTTPGPRLSGAFDDAWWLSPLVSRKPEK
ncbi:MAG: hypothetical protein R6V10_05585 [bacterium]